MSDIKEYTNRELGIILEDTQKDIKRLIVYIEGNGKKGLLDRMNDAEKCIENHASYLVDIANNKKAWHTRALDVVFKVGTTALLVFFGWDKLK